MNRRQRRKKKKQSTVAVRTPMQVGASYSASPLNLFNSNGRFVNGEKFPGGLSDGMLGHTYVDYVSLRQGSRNAALTNMAAKGILACLLRNELTKGLSLELTPKHETLGIAPQDASKWAAEVETQFDLWSQSRLCDHAGEGNFASIQRKARYEALVAGDCLVVLYAHKRTGLPQIKLIPSEYVMNPSLRLDDRPSYIAIDQGVEYDKRSGKHITYHVYDPSKSKVVKIPAWGSNTGRRIAFMIYSCEHRIGQRGLPLLGMAINWLDDHDKYRDATVRKAVVSAMIAAFIKRETNELQSLPFESLPTQDVPSSSNVSETNTTSITDVIPGMVLERLAPGESPVAFEAPRDNMSYEHFDRAFINGIAWALQIPPEILTMAFSHNYSASKAAKLEFDHYLILQADIWGDTFCRPIFLDWCLTQLTTGRLVNPALVQALRDPQGVLTVLAWLHSEWFGVVKMGIDPVKDATAFEIQVRNGWMTNATVVRLATGRRLRDVLSTLQYENTLKLESGINPPDSAQNGRNEGRNDDDTGTDN